jgi:phosphoribosylformylglycinamidine synthase
MAGTKIPVAVAHGEGRAVFAGNDYKRANDDGQIAIRYTDYNGDPTERYPLNPNGSLAGVTGVQTTDGRVLALMPHPERVVTAGSNSWYPLDEEERWGGVGPWFKIFQSARAWCS